MPPVVAWASAAAAKASAMSKGRSKRLAERCMVFSLLIVLLIVSLIVMLIVVVGSSLSEAQTAPGPRWRTAEFDPTECRGASRQGGHCCPGRANSVFIAS